MNYSNLMQERRAMKDNKINQAYATVHDERGKRIESIPAVPVEFTKKYPPKNKFKVVIEGPINKSCTITHVGITLPGLDHVFLMKVTPAFAKDGDTVRIEYRRHKISYS